MPRWAFTLIEILLVILILAVVLAVAWPSFQPTSHEQLRAAAEMVAAEIWLAQNLAITFNSKYQLRFDVPGNRFILKHSGNNPALDRLPPDAIVVSSDDPTSRIVDLDDKAALIGRVRLVGAATYGASAVPADFLEFGPTGALEGGGQALIWLSNDLKPSPRYVTIIVDGVTGSVQIGPVDALGPPNWLFE